MTCTCSHIDGYRIRKTGCPVHGENDARILAEKQAERDAVERQRDSEEAACAWSDYRKDYGVSSGHLSAAHQAFLAGWKAAREGDQAGVLR